MALSSGTAAVHLGLLNCGVKPGDEVIVQSFTFCASTHPVTYLGATPVLVDSELDTWNIDPELLEKAIIDRKEKTGKYPAAIVPVALYGMPYKADRIMEIANKYGIPVVEDAAEGFGSKYKGQVLGTFGKYGVLSFNGNKMITTSGGGALITEDEELLADVPGIHVHSQPNTGEYDSNYWLCTITIDENVKVKGQEDAYKTIVTGAVGGAAGVIHAAASAHTDCEPNTNVEAMRVALDKAQIEARPVWKPMHKQPCYKDAPAYVNGVSEALFKVGMCLPAGPYVSDDDVKYIVDTIKENIIG